MKPTHTTRDCPNRDLSWVLASQLSSRHRYDTYVPVESHRLIYRVDVHRESTHLNPNLENFTETELKIKRQSFKYLVWVLLRFNLHTCLLFRNKRLLCRLSRFGMITGPLSQSKFTQNNLSN